MSFHQPNDDGFAKYFDFTNASTAAQADYRAEYIGGEDHAEQEQHDEVSQPQYVCPNDRGLPNLCGEGSKKAAKRFPPMAIKVLRNWLEIHVGNPYPSDDERIELEKQTGLSAAQISTWFANARRRRTSVKSNKRSRSPSISDAMGIPGSDAGSSVTPWNMLNPLERWQHSPCENEPAPIHAIANAVAREDLPRNTASSSVPATGYPRNGSSSGSRSLQRAESLASMETTNNSMSLSAGSTAAWSGSHESFGSFSSFTAGLHGKRDRRRRRKVGTIAMKRVSEERKARKFQCTFCCDSFKTKYDWMRHEKSLHLSLEKWICTPLGGVVADSVTSVRKCVYCHIENPEHDHLDSHGHSLCHAKNVDGRTFYRKDHLRQHLRIVHGCDMSPHMEQWRVTAACINSRCGFCMQRFRTWQDRCDHLAAHFKDGADMKDWRGCRGLDPNVASQVLNAMPPYLIGMERHAPDPFSATKTSAWDNHYPDSIHAERGKNAEEEEKVNNSAAVPDRTNSTCWEILTVRLGIFAKEQTHRGVILTDEMLQRQARRILFDTEDTWDHTAADNAEWLDLFKKAQGLDILPDAIGGSGKMIPEDLEMYSDLGIPIPFGVQLEGIQKGNEGLEAPRIGDTPEFRNYTGYTQLVVPPDRISHFATIAEPTFVSGLLGRKISTAEWQIAQRVASPATQTTRTEQSSEGSGSQFYDTSLQTTPGSEAIHYDINANSLHVAQGEINAKDHSLRMVDASREPLAMDMDAWMSAEEARAAGIDLGERVLTSAASAPIPSDAELDKALEEFDFDEVTNGDLWSAMIEQPQPL